MMATILAYMLKAELISRIAERFPRLNSGEVELVISEILGAVGQQLVNGGRVEIRGFGVFCLNYRPPRVCRNPRTGQAVPVPAKWKPHFKAGKALRELIDA